MRHITLSTLVVLLSLSTTVNATVISFETDPFAGTDVLSTPGRQIVGGESFIDFAIASDVFAFDPSVFGVGSQVLFANDVVGNLSTTGLNVVVLQTLDNDSDPTTPFLAGNAANLIADRITDSGAGFFVYFNSALDLPRLVYSTDLSENQADLKILARMTNLTGEIGRSALPAFTASNFAMITDSSSVPEPSSLSLMAAAGGLWGYTYMRRRRRVRP